jgi:hypothetical protein
MIKTLLKLAIAVFIANACWQVGSAYLVNFRFQDAVMQAVEEGGRKSVEQLRSEIVDLTNDYDIPLAASDVDVHRDDRGHTYVDTSYVTRILLLPNYSYPWQFGVHVEDRGVSPGAPAGNPPR